MLARSRREGERRQHADPMACDRRILLPLPCFLQQPGFAFVKNDELTVGLEGFAYRLRPLESGE